MVWQAAFNIVARQGIYGATPALRILEAGVKEGLSSGLIVSALQAAGISYRRQDMLGDIRRMGSIIRIAEDAFISRDRAVGFYDRFIEPFREANGMTGEQAWSAYHRWRNIEEEEEDEMVDQLQAWGAEFGWY